MSDAPETKLRNVQHEWTLQRAVAAFLGKALPPEAYWTSLDLGKSTSAMQGAWRKLRGVKAGVPDVLIVWASKTVWLELKDGSVLSETQKTTRDALVRNGHYWYLCRSLEDVQSACEGAGIPLRATIGDIRSRIAEQNERLPAKPKKRAARRTGKVSTVSVAQAHKMGLWR